jgi:carotenoid 1,2-hydratase
MSTRDVPAARTPRAENFVGPRNDGADGTRRVRKTVPGDGRGPVRPGVARLAGLVRAAGVENPAAGALSRGGQRASGTGRADGGAFGTAGSNERDGGPDFAIPVRPDGYAWWYVDALSADGAFGLTIIAFVGSVFSPYYAWAGRRDPENHCAVNVALYGPRGARWAMTERGRGVVERDSNTLAIGPSALSWDGDGLTIRIDEISAPLPRRLRGKIRVHPASLNAQGFTLDEIGGHRWRPIAPSAAVEVELEAPSLSWSGVGYFDMNAGDEPLEDGFSLWTWSRAALPDGAAILYDADRRRAGPLRLALRFDRFGRPEDFAPPPRAQLPRTKWGVERETRSDDGAARIAKNFEDTPFYSRSLVATRLLGRELACIHESLSLDRFAQPYVRLMLPFRMPRW